MKFIKTFVIFSILFSFKFSFSQIYEFNKGQHKYHYVHNYIPSLIRSNKVKCVEMITSYNTKKYRYKFYFDTLGEIIKFEEYNTKDKLLTTKIHIRDENQVQFYDSLKNKEFILNVYSDSSFTFSNLKNNKIKEIFCTKDSTISHFNVKKKNKIQLYQLIIQDKNGNDKFVRFISDDDIVDTTDVYFDFNYSDKTFKSYSYYNNIKILVSIGVLNNDNKIIKENFYWIPYKDLTLDNLKIIEPEETVFYSINQNGLINQRTILDNATDFNVTFRNDKLSDSKINSVLNRITTDFHYEYYVK